MSPKHAKLRSIRGRSLALILAIGIAGGIGIATLLGTDEPVRINVGNCSLGESTPPMLPAEVAERVQGVNRSDLDPLLFAMSPGKLLLQPNGDWLLIGTLTDEVRQQWRRLAKSGPPRRLVVNTAGGDESVALELAADLSRWRRPLVILGQCGSACANYLLVAANEIELNGAVTMHGSPAGCLNELGVVGAWRRLGWSGYRVLSSAAKRQASFEKTHPQLIDVIRLSARHDRGDLAGQSHAWLLVPPNALQERLPRLVIGPASIRYSSAFIAMHRQRPDWGPVHAPASLPKLEDREGSRVPAKYEVIRAIANPQAAALPVAGQDSLEASTLNFSSLQFERHAIRMQE